MKEEKLGKMKPNMAAVAEYRKKVRELSGILPGELLYFKNRDNIFLRHPSCHNFFQFSLFHLTGHLFKKDPKTHDSSFSTDTEFLL